MVGAVRAYVFAKIWNKHAGVRLRALLISLTQRISQRWPHLPAAGGAPTANEDDDVKRPQSFKTQHLSSLKEAA